MLKENCKWFLYNLTLLISKTLLVFLSKGINFFGVTRQWNRYSFSLITSVLDMISSSIRRKKWIVLQTFYIRNYTLFAPRDHFVKYGLQFLWPHSTSSKLTVQKTMYIEQLSKKYYMVPPDIYNCFSFTFVSFLK